MIRAVDDEIQSRLRHGLRRRERALRRAVRHAVPRRAGPAVLTQPDDLLNTGIEVEAKPSRKNVKKLSLLSGGERSLTALAFLFAVFRSRPSPFYVMDEVEAALDDVNLHRFLGLHPTSSARKPSSSWSATRSARWRPPTASRRHDAARRLLQGGLRAGPRRRSEPIARSIDGQRRPTSPAGAVRRPRPSHDVYRGEPRERTY